ncbi:hypothetical protein [Antarctobacter jejuensis]|uniref:hypothetical protein n=1 Tax=Antarctobacter jejuensis TaxID=1439938 RepID=UPI003FCF8391
MTVKPGTMNDALQRAEDGVQALSRKSEQAGAALDALSQRIDAKVEALLDSREERK